MGGASWQAQRPRFEIRGRAGRLEEKKERANPKPAYEIFLTSGVTPIIAMRVRWVMKKRP
jgi:hypothetical protein